MHAEVAEHLCAASVVTLIWLETEVYVGIYGIVSFFLQLVGCNLVHQSYASAFLLHVDDYTLAGFLDHLHRLVQLLSAVASLASENVACGAR